MSTITTIVRTKEIEAVTKAHGWTFDSIDKDAVMHFIRPAKVSGELDEFKVYPAVMELPEDTYREFVRGIE